MPRGGARPGSGRKPKDPALRALDGGASHRSRAHPPPISPATTDPAATAAPVIAAIETFDPPPGLSKTVLRVWAQLAPYAFANRTLVRSTVIAFEMLCRNVALERALARKRLERGGPNHRGLIQRVDAQLLRFNLAPCGKPMYLYEQPKTTTESDPPTPANPLARFLKRVR